MPTIKESLPAVTAAGVVAIALCLFGAFGCLMAMIGFLLLPQMQQVQGGPELPQEARAFTIAFVLFGLALCVFGIFVGVGVIRRRNWARITMLIWGGFMAVVCTLLVVLMIFVFNAIPQAQLPNVRPGDAANVMRFLNVFVVVFYGIPAAIGIWWLALFTRSRVSEAFTNPAPAVPTMDASGFPELPAGTIAAPKRPSCPLPLAILAGFFIFSSVCTPFFVLMPNPYPMPFFFFGKIMFGLQAKLVLVGMSVVLGVCGIGMLRLRTWALHTALVVQGVFLINGTFSLISPTFMQDIREALEKVSGQTAAFPGGNPFLSPGMMRGMMLFGLLFGVFFVALMVMFRERFLEQAEAAPRTPV